MDRATREPQKTLLGLAAGGGGRRAMFPSLTFPISLEMKQAGG